MKKLLTLALSLALTATVGVASANTKLTVGASATPHAEILEAAKPILAEKGIDLEIVIFDDYVQPNLQLEATPRPARPRLCWISPRTRTSSISSRSRPLRCRARWLTSIWA